MAPEGNKIAFKLNSMVKIPMGLVTFTLATASSTINT